MLLPKSGRRVTFGRQRAGRSHLVRQLVAFPEDTAARVVHQVAVRKLPGFAGLHHFGIDDLKQEGLTAVRKAWPRYDPDTAAESTFIYSVAELHLRFVLRTAKRAQARE